ncbi:AroM family protein [Clostridium sp. 'deep sea']|uniref:AroM family protein n=1 Tax=Clostridium sp. 'deep sea' TaxID=2779445 RepID=UPI0018967E45|nr:AroM family protein [Clostridium sp. 'deep sea']QOR33677.1 AroM family protein [Clostridium sp. 'deep sea']
MEKIRIGAITIGQTPRVDITGDISSILNPHIEIVECGAVDNYSYDEITEKFAPTKHCKVLVSRMRDGKSVTLSEQKILPLVQNCINKLQNNNCKAILMLCTNDFPEFKHDIPLIDPSKILNSIVYDLVGKGTIGNILPSKNQIEKNNKVWKALGITAISVAASPYDSESDLAKAVTVFKDNEINLIYLNCLGYSVEMKNMVKKITNKPVILPRTILARILNEMYQ